MPLTADDQRHLSAAEGYAELEQIDPDVRHVACSRSSSETVRRRNFPSTQTATGIPGVCGWSRFKKTADRSWASDPATKKARCEACEQSAPRGQNRGGL
jgi:hypothetical protein